MESDTDYESLEIRPPKPKKTYSKRGGGSRPAARSHASKLMSSSTADLKRDKRSETDEDADAESASMSAPEQGSQRTEKMTGKGAKVRCTRLRERAELVQGSQLTHARVLRTTHLTILYFWSNTFSQRCLPTPLSPSLHSRSIRKAHLGPSKRRPSHLQTIKKPLHRQLDEGRLPVRNLLPVVARSPRASSRRPRARSVQLIATSRGRKGGRRKDPRRLGKTCSRREPHRPQRRSATMRLARRLIRSLWPSLLRLQSKRHKLILQTDGYPLPLASVAFSATSPICLERFRTNDYRRRRQLLRQHAPRRFRLQLNIELAR